MKKIVLSLSCITAVLLISNIADAKALWRCVASNKEGAMWYQYAPTRSNAAKKAMSRCRSRSRRSACSIHCYSPRTRLRCVAFDRAGKKWYWVSTAKKAAMSNAKMSCIYNSKVGGCRVNPKLCSSS